MIMVGIVEILIEMKKASSIAGFLLGIAGSYISDMLPKLYIPQNFDKRAADRYKKAAKRWSKIDKTRNTLYIWVDDFKSFKSYCELDLPEKEWVVMELMELWIEELHKDEICRQLVVELKLEEVKLMMENSLKEIKNTLTEINDFLRQFESKGTVEFAHNDHYIQRYCEYAGTNVEQKHLLGGYEYKTLADIVLAPQGYGAGRYVMYSDMQTGKTTELRHLGEVLAESGIYQPLLISAKSVKGLKYDDLPRINVVGRKTIVLMIDAIDETEEQGFCALVRDIENYAEHHRGIRIIVSCRRNFCSLAKPQGFTELELLPLRWDDTLAYIREKLGRKADLLVHEIIDKQLIELARVPLTLNVLVSSFDQEGKLPQMRSQLYERILMNSLNAEKEKRLKDFPMTIALEVNTMEKVAALMLMMGSREMTEEDFLKVLKLEGQGEYDHLRFDIIQRTERANNVYIGFNSNATMELLAAKYLLRYNNMDELKFLLYLKGTPELRPQWYGVLTLWLEMITENGDKLFIEEVKGWLLNEQKELAVTAPDTLIDRKLKGELTIELLKRYKSQNRNFYLLGDDQNPPIRLFSVVLVKYLKEEWERTTTFAKHFYNILRLTRMIDWKRLSLIDGNMAREFEALLYMLIDKPLFVLKATGCVYMAMTNDYFYSDEQIKKLYQHVENDNDVEVMEMMMGRIATLKNTDDYVDYIGRANERMVSDYRRGHHVMLRESIYRAIGKMTRKEALLKALDIINGDTYWKYADDRTLADNTYQKAREKTEELIDKADIEVFQKTVTQIEERRKMWMVQPLAQPSEEQKQGYADQVKNELELLCDLDSFRKIALRIVNYDNPQSTDKIVDLEYFYVHPEIIDGNWKVINQYMIEYLLQYASRGGESMWRISRLQGKKALDNGEQLRLFQMHVLYRFLSGERKDIKLTDEQSKLCCKTAQEELNRLVVRKSFNGRFTQSMRIALALFLDKKIDVAHNVENCRSLLKYICVPLIRSIDQLDDSENDMMAYLQTFVPTEEDFLKILTEQIIEAKRGFVDVNAYSKWIAYLLEAHYMPAVEYLTSLVINERFEERRHLVESLVKEESMLDVLKENAEIAMDSLKNGAVEKADKLLLEAVCDALVDDNKHAKWVREQLELYMDYCSGWILHRVLKLLFKLGSNKALEFVIKSNMVLRWEWQYEFTYSSISSVPLLVEVFNSCLRNKVYVPSIRSLLKSLENIALSSRDNLEIVRERIVNGCPRIGGQYDITPRQWAEKLEIKFASEHYGKMTLDEALMVIK